MLVYAANNAESRARLEQFWLPFLSSPRLVANKRKSAIQTPIILAANQFDTDDANLEIEEMLRNSTFRCPPMFSLLAYLRSLYRPSYRSACRIFYSLKSRGCKRYFLTITFLLQAKILDPCSVYGVESFSELLIDGLFDFTVSNWHIGQYRFHFIRFMRFQQMSVRSIYRVRHHRCISLILFYSPGVPIHWMLLRECFCCCLNSVQQWTRLPSLVFNRMFSKPVYHQSNYFSSCAPQEKILIHRAVSALKISQTC